MKRIFVMLLIACFTVGVADAQFGKLKGLGKKIEKAAKKEVEKAKEKTEKEAKKEEPQEKVYSFQELAEVFGISPITARAYFNMSQLDYNAKITIKEARELFKRF